jgi:glycosyltransferase involved in cell wall biosynthesis
VRLTTRLVNTYIERCGTPDLLHAHVSLWGGVAAKRAAERLGLPFVVTEHFSRVALGPLSSEESRGVKDAFQNAQRVVAVSTGLADALVRQGFADPARLVTIPNGVDSQFFTLPPRPRNLDGPFRILSVIRLEMEKGAPDLIHAFARAFGDHPGVVLEVVGGGPLIRPLRGLANKLGIASRVAYLGPLTRGELLAAMWRSHLLVLPSRYETFGMVLIEALATGLPVLATASGGPEDIVTTEVGRLVSRDNQGELAAGMAEMRRDWSSFDPVGMRRYVIDRFGSESVARRLQALYSEVLQS